MVITVGGWIGILIGFGIGGILGIICGFLIGDEHWKKKTEELMKTFPYNQAPYEIEKENKHE